MVANIINRVIKRVQVTLYPTIHDRELRRWYQDDVDRERRFAYTLTSKSTVIDVGGYDGQWTSDLFSRYLSEVHVFEAVPAFAEKISRRFAANSKIRVYPYAVGRNSRADRMSLCGVGSSLFRGSGFNKNVAVRVEDAGGLFRLCNISHCDLLKINIEGGEYEVLPRLIETGLISEIDNLQIQFHNLGPGSLAQMKSIQAELSKTHIPTWQYTWVLENWKRKDTQL